MNTPIPTNEELQKALAALQAEVSEIKAQMRRDSVQVQATDAKSQREIATLKAQLEEQARREH